MFEENSDSENLKRRITLIAGLKNNVEIVKKNLEEARKASSQYNELLHLKVEDMAKKVQEKGFKKGQILRSIVMDSQYVRVKLLYKAVVEAQNVLEEASDFCKITEANGWIEKVFAKNEEPKMKSDEAFGTFLRILDDHEDSENDEKKEHSLLKDLFN